MVRIFKALALASVMWLLFPTAEISLNYPTDSPADWQSEEEYWEFQNKWIKHGRVVVYIDGGSKWFYRNGKKCRF